MNYIDIKTPIELYQYMKENIKYGFIDKRDNKMCFRKELGDERYERTLVESYFLQTPNQLLISNCGICYDQVELARVWLSNHGYQVNTYFTTYHNHAILIYSNGNKYFLFERTFKELNGIFEFSSLENALDSYLQKQIDYSKNKINSIIIYPYDNVTFGCSFREFRENIIVNNEEKVLKTKNLTDMDSSVRIRHK